MEFLGSTAAFLAFILGFGFLVFVHELGHFLVAKWVGVKCTQFAIGFGPSIFAWRKGLGVRTGSTESEYEQRVREHLENKGIDPDKAAQARPAQHEDLGPTGTGTSSTAFDQAANELGLGETEYRLNYVPLGGYVKMLGQEDLDPTARSNDPRSFNAKPIWARACVISAGVVMNIIFGLLFFIVAFMSGVEFPPSVVGRVEPTMPAAQAYAEGHENEPAYQGLQVGDRITAIDGDPVEDWMEVRIATALGAPGEPVTVSVDRPTMSQPLRYRMTPEPSPQDGLLSIGVAPAFDHELVAAVSQDSEAYRAGVRAGWQLVAVEGEPVTAYHDYYRALMREPGRPITAAFADPEGNQRTTVTLRAQPLLQQPEDPQSESAHLAGFIPPTRVAAFSDTSAAEEGGVEAGDLIVRLDGAAWPSPVELSNIVRNAGDRPLSITVQRDGEQITLDPIRPRSGLLGIHMSLAEAPVIGKTRPNSPAATLELASGSRILEIADEPVASWADMQRAFASLAPVEPGETVEVPVAYRLNLAGQPREQAVLTLTAEQVTQLQQARWGVPRSILFDVLREPLVAANPWQAAVLGVEKTGQFIAHTYLTIVRLVQGTVQVHHLRGPVGIVDEGTRITQHGGWQYLIFFLGLISVNLAVINFLPIPIVDGGHILFLIVEKLKGSPVSVGVQAAATYVGLALIAAIFLATLFYDVLRLVSGGP